MALEYPIDITRQDLAKGTPETEPSTDSTGMTDEELAQFFNNAFTTADEARKPREAVWKESWQLYMGQYDWSGKADWQSKSNIPKVRTAVDRTAAAFRRSLIRLKQFYQVESESQLGREKGLFSIQLLDYWLGRSNFTEEFTTSVKTGLVTSMSILKVFWDWTPETVFDVDTDTKYEPRKEFGVEVGLDANKSVQLKEYDRVVGKFCVKAVDPFRFWILPRFQGNAVFEQTEMQLSDLEILAERGIYSKSAIKEIKQKRMEAYRTAQEEAKRKGENAESASIFFKPVELFHYWGDIYNDEGECKMRNATFTIADKEIIIRKPRKNPFFHGKVPYVWGSPFIVPFSTYNRGMVEDVTGLATMITELANLVVDGAQFEAAKGFEVDIDLLNDRGDLRDGIYPGVVLPKKGLQSGPVDKKLITPIDTGKVPTESIGVLGLLTNEFNDAMNITLPGLNTTKKASRTTAKEAEIRSSGGFEGIEDAARTIEETLVNPFLEIAIKTIYQFHDDYIMPRLIENFSQTSSLLRDMTSEERYVTMVGDHSFKARGISLLFDKQQNLQRVIEFMQLAGSIPGVLQKVNIDAFLEEIFNSMGWNPNKMLLQQQQPVSTPAEPAGPAGTPFPNEVTPNARNPMQAQAGLEGAIKGGSANNPMA